jgi:hypothetical protein
MIARGIGRLEHACQTGRHSRAARGFDLYETPPIAVEALLAVENLPHWDLGTVCRARRDCQRAAQSRPCGVMSRRHISDRAAVVTTAIMQMIATAWNDAQLQRQIEDYLHDQFVDLERRVAAERESGDAP